MTPIFDHFKKSSKKSSVENLFSHSQNYNSWVCYGRSKVILGRSLKFFGIISKTSPAIFLKI